MNDAERNAALADAPELVGPMTCDDLDAMQLSDELDRMVAESDMTDRAAAAWLGDFDTTADLFVL